MKKIIYYVAISLDGYICGPDEDVSKFVDSKNGIEKYLQDLQAFKTTIMGRKTYEFGYKFGLQPGQPAYLHMEHFIFSGTLEFEEPHDLIHIKSIDIAHIEDIRKYSTTDIYLCGGGEFAGWLLDHQQIDQLKLKINPIILGGGIKLFGASKTAAIWELIATEQFDRGLQISTFNLMR